MKNPDIKSIDDVINLLDSITEESEFNNNTLGYFAALYRKVTLKVKEGIEQNFFDDGERMEQLDIIFAKRYFDAYFAWKEDESLTESWKITFENANNYWPIVLQHLLLGMNAHINLDLGIAAVEVSKNKNINELKDDFMKINEILSSLVYEVQNNLSQIWPFLSKILKRTGKTDDFIVDFSMKLARDGAWDFACELAEMDDSKRLNFINLRDKKVAKKAKIVLSPGQLASLTLKIIRLGERGTISKKIQKLMA